MEYIFHKGEFETALEREVCEEINCEIDKSDCVGYIEAIDEDTRERELRARMVARISWIGEPKPDPDRENNWIYGRVLARFECRVVRLECVTESDYSDGGGATLLMFSSLKRYF